MILDWDHQEYFELDIEPDEYENIQLQVLVYDEGSFFFTGYSINNYMSVEEPAILNKLIDQFNIEMREHVYENGKMYGKFYN